MTQTPPPVPRRALGGLEVSALGLGCMGMSQMYGTADRTESLPTLHRALDLGVTFLDTSDVYGEGHNEELVGEAIAGRRDEVQLATKFAISRAGCPAGALRPIPPEPDCGEPGSGQARMRAWIHASAPAPSAGTAFSSPRWAWAAWG